LGMSEALLYIVLPLVLVSHLIHIARPNMQAHSHYIGECAIRGRFGWTIGSLCAGVIGLVLYDYDEAGGAYLMLAATGNIIVLNFLNRRTEAQDQDLADAQVEAMARRQRLYMR
jgi:hypothetical protein